MYGVIASFLFVYWFIFGLYILMRRSHQTDNNNEVQNDTDITIEQRISGERDLYKLYPTIFKIPIIEHFPNTESDQSKKSEPETNKICKICQREVPIDSNYCIFCGAKIL